MTELPYEVSDRVRAQALTRAFGGQDGHGRTRPLRIFTLDPSVSHRVGGIATVGVPLEELRPGPLGALFEIRADGAPEPLVAAALDLDDPAVLLAGGLAPTPADARFHLQMAYAVCTLTYAAFRRALGRDIAWAAGTADESGCLRLRVEPFGDRNRRNAYYQRETGRLVFGWFRARRRPAGHTVPGGLIFTGLSHDVLVHETTHALLDALRSEFALPTTPDVLGFHEGFADIVAVLQHFSYPEVVEQALRESRGAVSRAALLTGLAREFGFAAGASGRASPLRCAVDAGDDRAFDSDALDAATGLLTYRPGMEEHALGSVLLSAVFEAFATVFRRKSERYFRLAGIAPGAIGQADLGSELVRALAKEASDIAGRFLDICIRAVDYCPPVDLEIGEYLRALITADADMVADDHWGYREALMRSFRRRLLFPDHVPFMTEDAVRWQPPERPVEIEELAFRNLRFDGDPGRPADPDEMERQAHAIGRFVSTPEHARALHLVAPGARLPKGLTYAAPPSIRSVRCARRAAPDGRILFDLVAEVTQTCTARVGTDLFEFPAGATIVIDPFGRVRYAIYKKAESRGRQERQHAALTGPLRGYWRKRGKSWTRGEGVFRRLHGVRG